MGRRSLQPSSIHCCSTTTTTVLATTPTLFWKAKMTRTARVLVSVVCVTSFVFYFFLFSPLLVAATNRTGVAGSFRSFHHGGGGGGAAQSDVVSSSSSSAVPPPSSAGKAPPAPPAAFLQTFAPSANGIIAPHNNNKALLKLNGSSSSSSSFSFNRATSHALETPLSEGDRVPMVTFHTRHKIIDDVKDPEHKYHHEWLPLTSDDYFKTKRVVVFGLPGAFTPTCTNKHLPRFEELYDAIRQQGIDEVYCLTPNDSFVTNAWKKELQIQRINFIPDGDLEFTVGMKMDVWKRNLGLGLRTWRYSMVVDNGTIEKMFVEPGRQDDAADDPYTVSDADTMYQYLKQFAEFSPRN